MKNYDLPSIQRNGLVPRPAPNRIFSYNIALAALCWIMAVTISSAQLPAGLPDSIRRTLRNIHQKEVQIDSLITWAKENPDRVAKLSYLKELQSWAKSIRYLKGESEAWLGIGNAYFNAGEWSKGFEAVGYAEQGYNDLNDLKGIIRVKNAQGYAYYTQGKVTEAAEVYQSGYRLAVENDFQEDRIQLLGNISSIAFIQGDYTAARAGYQEAMDYALSQGNQASVALHRMNIGLIEHGLGNYAAAADYFKSAIEIGDELEDLQIRMGGHCRLAMVRVEQGQLENGMKHFFQGIEIAEILQDARTLNISFAGVSRIYNTLGNYDRALLYADKALAASIKLGDVYGQGIALLEKAATSRFKNLLDTAMSYAELALEHLSVMKYGKALGDAYTEMARIQAAQARYPEAQNFFHIADSIYSANDEIDARYGLLVDESEVLFEMDHHNHALSKLNEAYRLGTESGHWEYREKMLKLLVGTNAALGNLPIAFQFQSELLAFRDSIHTKEIEYASLELLEKYEAEQYKRTLLENELELVSKDKKLTRVIWQLAGLLVITFILSLAVYYQYHFRKRIAKSAEIIRRQNERLEQLSVIKNRLLGLVSHDLRTPLFTGMEMIKDIQKSIPESAGIDRLLKQFTKSYFFLENLLFWVKTQWDDFRPVHDTVAVVEALDECLEVLKDQYEKKGQTIRYDIPADLTVCFDSQLLRLMLRNLVFNAIQHTPQGGTVSVEVMDGEHEVKVSILDTGPGIDCAKVAAALKGELLNPNSSKAGGVGLALTATLLAASDGRLEVGRNTPTGSIFSAFLPKY